MAGARTLLLASLLAGCGAPRAPKRAASAGPADGPWPSRGCDALGRQPLASGDHTIEVRDPALGNITRSFVLQVPESAATHPGGAPLLLGFHGQGGNPADFSVYLQPLTELAALHGWVVAWPAGLREDYVKPDGGTGSDSTWNCGTAADDATCLAGTTEVQCMESCRKLGMCGRCNWATCYSDVDFITQLLEHLEEGLCLDTSSFFVTGASNGGMFTHYLVQEMPGRFRAAAPVFGTPLLGYEVGSEYQLVAQRELCSRTSLIQLHDASDTVIPWQGANSSDGWLYEPMSRTVGAWAGVHQCESKAVPIQTPFDGGLTHVRCSEFLSCGSGGRAMYCLYDGEHGDIPEHPRGEALLMWFFESVSRESVRRRKTRLRSATFLAP